MRCVHAPATGQLREHEQSAAAVPVEAPNLWNARCAGLDQIAAERNDRP